MNAKEKFEKIVIDIEDFVQNDLRKASEISEQIAFNMLMGYRELNDVFKFFTDRSLNEYIKERKMMAAYALILTQDEMNVDNAIEISGLDNQSSFGKKFKEVLACPGHTAGSLVMLIPEERMLLLGDACNYMVFLFDDLSSKVSEYKASLISLHEKVAGRYDTVLLSHGGGLGVPDMIERVIEVCDDILEGRSEKAPFNFIGNEALMAHAVGENRQRIDGGVGNIVYSELTLG